MVIEGETGVANSTFAWLKMLKCYVFGIFVKEGEIEKTNKELIREKFIKYYEAEEKREKYHDDQGRKQKRE